MIPMMLVKQNCDFLDRTVTGIVTPDDKGKWIAGVTSDMLLQRRSDAKAARGIPERKGKGGRNHDLTGASKMTVTAPPPPNASGQKLSYKQKFALESLPKTIATLGKEIAETETEMASPTLFTKDPTRFAKLAKKLDSKRAELAKAEDEWLELEMLRAEVEG